MRTGPAARAARGGGGARSRRRPPGRARGPPGRRDAAALPVAAWGRGDLPSPPLASPPAGAKGRASGPTSPVGLRAGCLACRRGPRAVAPLSWDAAVFVQADGAASGFSKRGSSCPARLGTRRGPGGPATACEPSSLPGPRGRRRQRAPRRPADREPGPGRCRPGALRARWAGARRYRLIYAYCHAPRCSSVLSTLTGFLCKVEQLNGLSESDDKTLIAIYLPPSLGRVMCRRSEKFIKQERKQFTKFCACSLPEHNTDPPPPTGRAVTVSRVPKALQGAPGGQGEESPRARPADRAGA